MLKPNEIMEIYDNMGCSNCRNAYGVAGEGPCKNCTKGCENCATSDNCKNCHSILNHYVPKRNTIFEKVFYHEEETITSSEYQEYLKKPW